MSVAQKKQSNYNDRWFKSLYFNINFNFQVKWMIPGAKSAVDIMYSCKKMINDVGSICPLPVTLLSSDSY